MKNNKTNNFYNNCPICLKNVLAQDIILRRIITNKYSESNYILSCSDCYKKEVMR